MQHGFLEPLIERARSTPGWKPIAWTVVLSAVWALLWFWPWQIGIREFIWLRLGIALGMFLVPGLGLYRLLRPGASSWSDSITFGFVLSHLIIALLGILGRLFHLSFDLIRDMVMALGLILLLPALVPILAGGVPVRFGRASLRWVPVAASLGLVAFLAGQIVLQRVLSDDDLTYLAFVTEWQGSAGLDFRDVIFGTGQIIQPRFWLVSAPLAQAFLAATSGLHPIFVLGGYYEPFLVVLAMLCWYRLARTLGLSRPTAGVSVILQIVFLLLLSEYLHPGAAFSNQLSVDKATATFILAPVFLQSGIRFLKDPARSNILLFLLTGLCLTMMHPIALAYAAFIAGTIALLNMDRRALRIGLMVMGVLIILLLPQAALRIVGADLERSMLADVEGIGNQIGYENLVTVWRGSPFYSFNPQILGMRLPYETGIPLPQVLLEFGWLIIPLAAFILSMRQLRRDYLARYIFSASLLTLLAGIPLTGWIIGYFLSPWMLERAAWFLPLGLGAVFVLLAIRNEMGVGRRIHDFLRAQGGATSFPQWPLAITTLCAAGMILLVMRERGLPDQAVFAGRFERYNDLAWAGRYLDGLIPNEAVVVGSDELNDLIPGLARKASLLTFRTSSPAHMPFHSLEEIRERSAARRTIFSRKAPAEERLRLLAAYNVEYVLLRRTEYDFFRNLVAANPSHFERTDLGRYVILKFLH